MEFRFFTIKKLSAIFILFFILALAVHIFVKPPVAHNSASQKLNAYWKTKLTAEQYHVLREGGTDVPFTHEDMLNNHQKGTYVTADCGEPVFRSEDKFDSGTGWPSFTKPIDDKALILKEDDSLGEIRTEVLGSKCGGHLGHVFDDGPTVLPDGRQGTGKRYCINASALKFIPDKQ